MTQRLAANARIAVGVALAVLFAMIALLFVRFGQQFEEARVWVRHTYNAINATHTLNEALLDSETSQRGYLITGSRDYLSAYMRARDRVPTSQAELRRLTMDNPAQQTRLDRLEPLVQQKLEELAKTIRLRDDAGFQETQREVQTHFGRNLMREIQTIIDQMSAEEDQLLRMRQGEAQAAQKRTLAMLGLGGVLAFGVMAGSGLVLRREERRRRAAEREALASATQLRTSFDGLSHGIAVFGGDRRLIEWNRCLIELLDIPDAVIRKGVTYEDLTRAIDPDLFESADQIAHDVRAAGSREAVVHEATSKGGRNFEFRRTMLPGGDGFILTVTDVTAQRKAELVQRDNQKMQALGHLTGGVAHDFNNLLTVVMGNLDLLRKRLPDDPEIARRLDDAIASAVRGANLTRHLLAFARRQPLEPRPINLNRLVADLVNSMLRRTLGEEIAIQAVESGGLWPAFADPAQVENAVLNLALNARDAMPKGGRLTIEISNQMLDHHYARLNPEVEPGAYVMIAVTDTGTGMSPETVSHAFEPFYSTKEEGKGTGLGLSQVYGFAKQSKGHVKIYSELGQGTTVKLYLPRSQRAVNDDLAQASRDVPRGNAVILVVEDDADVRRVVVAQLEELGYDILAAPDAESALDAFAKADRIDLLLTDVILPGRLRGKELATLVKRASPQTQVLFMSGYTENAIVHDGKLDEGVNLISKPFRREDIARKVAQVLQMGAPAEPAADGKVVRFPDRPIS
jgi:signal transduction histidine kinase/CHASE3 domain sensor protein/ActR/RegA family two-component response regulator